MIEKKFVKKEKVYWVGRPSQRVIESKAGINVIIGIVCLVVGAAIAGLSFLIPSFPPDAPVPSWLPKAILIPFGGCFFALGIYMILRRKSVGGSTELAYVVTSKHAYICDLAKEDIRVIAPAKIGDLEVKESKIEDAGDLILFYELDASGAGVQSGVSFGRGGNSSYERMKTPIGFLNLEQVHLVKQMVREVLVDAIDDKKKAKKQKEQEQKEQEREKRKSRRPW